uniref:Proline rich and Gla domain 4 n=1 Tax=Canis lupus familiaris TaxID=9615 RepID=A0A8C0T908_CANLF
VFRARPRGAQAPVRGPRALPQQLPGPSPPLGGPGGRRDNPTPGLRPGSCCSIGARSRRCGARGRWGGFLGRGGGSAPAPPDGRAEGAARRCPQVPARPAAGPGARLSCPGAPGLSGPGRATETREPGRSKQVGDSGRSGTQSAEPGAFLTFFLLLFCFVLGGLTVTRLCLPCWFCSANCPQLASRFLIAQEVPRSPGMREKKMAFWQKYSIKGPTTKSDANREKIDVMGLLTGLIAAGVFLVIFGLLGYYLCITKCNRQQYPSSSATYVRRHTPSIIFRRPEEAALNPSPLSVEDTGLPSYEQAMALTRKHNVSPPPPYPGPAKEFRVFKKSMSLPSH